jgi:hypothetical protein
LVTALQVVVTEQQTSSSFSSTSSTPAEIRHPTPNLRSLNLSNCLVTADCVAALAGALPKLTTLK